MGGRHRAGEVFHLQPSPPGATNLELGMTQEERVKKADRAAHPADWVVRPKLRVKGVAEVNSWAAMRTVSGAIDPDRAHQVRLSWRRSSQKVKQESKLKSRRRQTSREGADAPRPRAQGRRSGSRGRRSHRPGGVWGGCQGTQAVRLVMWPSANRARDPHRGAVTANGKGRGGPRARASCSWARTIHEVTNGPEEETAEDCGDAAATASS